MSFRKLSMVCQRDTPTRHGADGDGRLQLRLRFVFVFVYVFVYRLGETTCREIVYDTCRAIIEVLGPQYLPPPTADTWKASESGFRNRWEFPNCVTALDGKQVVMEAPANTGSAYFTYKRQFAMVLMAAVDSNYNFVYVSVGSAGRESVDAIFRSLDLGRRFVDGGLYLPGPKALPRTTTVLPHVIVGDEIFPQVSSLMWPDPG